MLQILTEVESNPGSPGSYQLCDLNASDPQVPPLCNEDGNNNTYLIRNFGGPK